MAPNDMGIPDIAALVRFGRLGMAMFASRVLSILALSAFFGLCFYTVYAPASWIGAAVCAIAAIVCMFAMRAEAAARQPSDGGAPDAR